jgi:Ion channel
MFLLGILGILLIAFVLLDVFETIVLPRRVSSPIRLTSVFYQLTWTPWSALGRRMRGPRREGYLGAYGPLSLLILLGLWIAGLIVGYALVFWGFDVPLVATQGGSGFGIYLYMSGTTLLTLGLGDVLPHTALGRVLTVFEVGTGFGVLALVIGFLPVLYNAFSAREINIALLDARAGTPPSAGEVLLRYGQAENDVNLSQFLRDWERWAAELMESHLTYPVLAYYRSQHENQSWVTSLTAILDLATLIMTCVDKINPRVARLAFATTRHAAVDIARVIGVNPAPPEPDRLPPEALDRLLTSLAAAGVSLRTDPDMLERFRKLRTFYEPYVNALSQYFLMPLPPWTSTEETLEYWRRV